MPEQLLHRAQVGAAFEQVRRRGVAQAVRPDVGRARHRGHRAVHDVAHRARVDAAPARAEQQRRAAAGAGQLGAPGAQPVVERALGGQRRTERCAACCPCRARGPPGATGRRRRCRGRPARTPGCRSRRAAPGSAGRAGERRPPRPSSDARAIGAPSRPRPRPASSTAGRVRCARGLASSAPGSDGCRPARCAQAVKVRSDAARRASVVRATPGAALDPQPAAQRGQVEVVERAAAEPARWSSSPTTSPR